MKHLIGLFLLHGLFIYHMSLCDIHNSHVIYTSIIVITNSFFHILCHLALLLFLFIRYLVKRYNFTHNKFIYLFLTGTCTWCRTDICEQHFEFQEEFFIVYICKYMWNHNYRISRHFYKVWSAPLPQYLYVLKRLAMIYNCMTNQVESIFSAFSQKMIPIMAPVGKLANTGEYLDCRQHWGKGVCLQSIFQWPEVTPGEDLKGNK